MTPQPQYIITKEDYDQIYCIQYPLTSEERRRICERSRPTPAADAPTTRCCESCKNIPCKPLNRIPCVHHPENPCIEIGCTDIENCDEICEHSRIFSPAWVKQHDATIRNQTLDDFLKEIKGDVDPALDYIDLDSIEAAYIRLRHQSTEGGDE